MGEALEFLKTFCRFLVVTGSLCLVASIPFMFVNPVTGIVLLITSGICLGIGLIPQLVQGIMYAAQHVPEWFKNKRESAQTDKILSELRKEHEHANDDGIEMDPLTVDATGKRSTDYESIPPAPTAPPPEYTAVPDSERSSYDKASAPALTPGGTPHK